MKKILFIINPVSGIGRQRLIENAVEENLDKKQFDYAFEYTERAKHATEIAKDKAGEFDIITATGGDGTVNEVAGGLIGTETIMAIIPTGSGNGLARFLKIPMDIHQAITCINQQRTKRIDSGKLNGNPFVNVAGVGFDAHISHKFAKLKRRGFFNYIRLIFKEFAVYKAANYNVDIDGRKYRFNSFLISIANSSQYGNNGHIAPYAKIDDGNLDVCMLKPFPVLAGIDIGLRLLLKNIHKSSYMRIVRGQKISIETEGEIPVHIDGEPLKFDSKLEIEVIPKSLRIITGDVD